ncbi:hypothetical protein D9M72_311310 [compost metagenome]
MSLASAVATSKTVAAISPTWGARSPAAAIRITDSTKADEIGFWSTMPTEIPLTSANTSTSSTAISWKPNGWPNHATPAATVAAPHNSAQAATQPMPGPRRGAGWRRARHWRHACASSKATSTAAAPMIMPSATRKVALR